jgi:hypothetical protein
MGLAHAAWGVTMVLALALVAASLPGYSLWFRGVNPLVPESGPGSGFNVLSGVASLITTFVCLVLGIILFRKKRDDPMALFVSFYVIAYGVLLGGSLEYLNTLLPEAPDDAAWLIQSLFLTTPTLCLIILMPDGRAIPRWTRWLIPLSLASLVPVLWTDLSSMVELDTLPALIWAGLLMLAISLAVGAQIYRYRRVSTPTQRKQTRWLVFGLTIWIVLMAIQAIPFAYLQSLPPGFSPPAWAAASGLVWWLSLSIVPVTLTIAILRYRLYEIDVIINRALVYGALTAILAGMYSASISLFQKVFIALTGAESDAAIVITTLILASGFTPIRTRLQTVVDRRFRDGHDPIPRLAEFSKYIDGGIWVVDMRLAMERLLAAAIAAFDAVGGEVSWQSASQEQAVIAQGQWNGRGHLMALISAGGIPVGRIALGSRRNGSPYTSRDATTLSSAVESLSRVLAMTPKA